MNSGQLHRSVFYLDSAFETIDNPGTLDLWEKYNMMVFIHTNYDYNLDDSFLYLDSMYWVLEGKEKNYKREYAQTYFAEGEILKAHNKYDEAFQILYKGRSFAQKNLDSCDISQLTFQLGVFKYTQRLYKEAIPYFKQALLEKQQCSDSMGTFVTVRDPQMYMNTIALSYERTDMPDSAVYFYKEALKFVDTKAIEYPEEQLFLELAKGVIIGNLGGVLASMGKFSEAEEYLLESIRINDRPGYDIQDAQTAKIKLAELYFQLGRMREAKILLDQLDKEIPLREGKNNTYYALLLKLYQLKWQYEDHEENILEAYRHLKTYHALYDSTEKINKELQYMNMEESFIKAEQQYKLSLISRDNQIKNIYLFVTLLFSLLVVGVLLIVYYNLKKYRSINKEISRQNFELQEALGALEQSQAENTKIMHIVAHDLRNPISRMTMIADVLLGDGQWSEDDRVLLENIKTSGNNSLNLVEEMMRVNKDASGLKKETVDLCRMLNYCVDLLRYKAEEKKQKLTLDAVPVTAAISREKMWRVLSNLIANAIKFTPRGGIIKIKMDTDESKVRILVEDNGIGIPKHIQASIFEMFTSGKREGTEGEMPFGMGLAISKQIVTAHGGEIWFDSKEGEGTIFYVELPVQ